MSKSVKQFIWQILTAVARKIPGRFVGPLCDLAFESQQSKNNAAQRLIVLLEIQTRLRWYIDQQAINYSGGIHPKHRLMSYHRFFKEKIQHDDSVLDIGCGCGALAYSMAETGARVTGIDCDINMLESAKTEFGRDNISYLYCDITQDLPEGEYSVIVMSNVLEHLEKRSEILCSLVEAYSPRTILLRVPMINRHWDVPLRKELGLAHYLDPTHTVEYTFASFDNEMKEVSLEIIDHEIVWGEIWAEVVKSE